jgi:uncharacterized membrane protein YphA (DoxX/SURF4 family)
MNILLWVLQVLGALLYGASGVMNVFMFDKVSEGVPSFGALPREAWMALGILELVCTVGLIFPAAFRWQPALTVVWPPRSWRSRASCSSGCTSSTARSRPSS